MEHLTHAAIAVLPLAYLLAATAYGFLFFTGSQAGRRASSPLLWSAVLLHLGYLIALTLRWHQFPAATVSQALSVVAFAVAAVYAFVEWHGRERSTGFWMISLAFVFQALSSLLHSPDTPDRALFHNPLFAAHVSLALLGYAAFAVAAGYGFLFLELYRELKVGRFSLFYGKLPPLQVLERMMTGALGVGFAALSGAVIAGVVWAQQLFPGSWLHDPKILFTFATWALYGAALLLRHRRRWQGRQTAVASLAGLAAILFSLVAVNFLFTGFHGFR